jgi:D-amino-acid dehydrogenase
MSSSNKPIVILGGGIIGLFSAYYLQKTGHKNIIILDKSAGTEGCSFGNAGMIVPSHFIPLASPGIISKGIKWMFDSKSPFYLKPRLNLDLARWGLSFYKNSNADFVEKAAPSLRDISLLSKNLYVELNQKEEFKFDFLEKGLLLYCLQNETFEEEIETAEYAHKLGLKANILDNLAVKQLEPNMNFKGVGAVFYPGDAHLNPRLLTENLKSFLQSKGVQIIHNAEIRSLEKKNKTIDKINFAMANKKESLEPASVVLAAGAWSQDLAKMLHIYLPMQAGKGYSLETQQDDNQKFIIPSILVESRVAVTPFDGNKVRFGGTMELGGLNHKLNLNRVKGITNAAPKFFENMTEPKIYPSKVWHGLRPCSPDGLPYIGQSKLINNLFFNTGHAMMGISLAPGSGKLLAECVENKRNSIEINNFNPDRF